VRQVDQMGPVMLVGEHRHAEHQGVDTGQHPPGRAQDARDLGDHRLGGQVRGQGTVLGDDVIGAAVGQEGQPGGIGDHRVFPLASGAPPSSPSAFTAPPCSSGRLRRRALLAPSSLLSPGSTGAPLARRGSPGGTGASWLAGVWLLGPGGGAPLARGGVVDHAQDFVAGQRGEFRGWRARSRDVHDRVPPAGQPGHQLGPRHGVVKLPVSRKMFSIRRGDGGGRMVHGPGLLTQRSRSGDAFPP